MTAEPSRYLKISREDGEAFLLLLHQKYKRNKILSASFSIGIINLHLIQRQKVGYSAMFSNFRRRRHRRRILLLLLLLILLLLFFFFFFFFFFLLNKTQFNIFRPHKWGRKIMVCDAFFILQILPKLHLISTPSRVAFPASRSWVRTRAGA